MTSSSLPPRGTSAVPSPPPRPAPVRARLLAAAVDTAAGLGAGAVLLILLHLAAGQSWAVSLLIALVVVVTARGALLAWSGWSPGGRVAGVRLVDAKTLSPSPMGAFLYTELTLVVVVATLGLGLILLMRSVEDDPQHRGWHDRVSGLTALSVTSQRPAGQPSAVSAVSAGSAAAAQGPAPRADYHPAYRQAGGATGGTPGSGAGAASDGAPDRAPRGAGSSASPADLARTAPPTRPVPPVTRRGLRRLSSAAPFSQTGDMPRFANDSPSEVVPSQPMDAQPPAERSRLNQQPPTPRSPQPAGTRSHGPQDDASLMGASAQDGARRRHESVFATERYSFASRRSRPADVAHTFDTASITSASDRSPQALIDSVPWSSVPTALDPTTMDSLPDDIRTVIADEHLVPSTGASGPSDGHEPAHALGAGSPEQVTAPAHGGAHSPAQAPMDLLNPAEVPAPASAAPSVSAPSQPSPAAASPPPPSAQSAPSAPPARQQAGPAPSPSASSSAAASTIEVPALRASQRASQTAPQAPRSSATTPDGTPAPAASPGGGQHAGPLAPPLSVRLVPLLGGDPIVIHEPTVIGRDPDNISSYPGAERVSLTDPTRSVSKTHAAIFPLLDGVWVTDLHSTNGSRVERKDGSSVQAVPDVALAALEGTTVFFGRIGFRIEVMG